MDGHGNARRFFRIDMPMQVYIEPKTRMKNAEIFASGVNYFPSSVQDVIDHAKFITLDWVDQMQEQKDRIRPIFAELIENVEFFGLCLEKMSYGKNPRNNLGYWANFKDRLQPSTLLSSIKDSAPRTHQYLKLLEDKFLHFLNSLILTIENSDKTQLAVDKNLPHGFKIDEVIVHMHDPKFSRTPLVQAIVYLDRFIRGYTDIYRQITEDNLIKRLPKKWPTHLVNVSASGIALDLKKSYEAFDQLDVYIYLPNTSSVLHFDGEVVNCHTENQIERIAINFAFPDGKHQDQLQNAIQKYEIKECLELDLEKST